MFYESDLYIKTQGIKHLFTNNLKLLYFLKNLDGGDIGISKTDSDIMKLLFTKENKLGGTSGREKINTGVKAKRESLSGKMKF